ncbi:MAG: tRNA (N(6)-L-threonylcarbamoyladenosine(37)-C(2))-methylthiotransferase MtaB [Acidiferrobacterales bacterium]|nr:tRNA (N(6)-L-threonylcarbamoyladenosine(37)-C(2))-methylthiotransferase MtaB [Acidiferrobacterales bacterium]
MSEFEVQLGDIGRQPASVNLREALDGKASTVTKTVGISTLGCKVNTYESELIGQTLQTHDWRLVNASEAADLYLINTCTVTREADRQARQEVRKVIKRNPDAIVIVTGCYAQIDPQACAAIPGVDLVLGNDQKLDVHKLIPQLEKGHLPKVMVGDLDQHISLPEHLLSSYEAHTRAFVQIQQGCDQGCTFCIIHVARGPSRSFVPSLIKRQVQRLVLNGYPEIVICGVDLGAYGVDFNSEHQQFDLVDLLIELLNIEHDPCNPFRIRISSIDPHHISERFIDLVANQPRICSHIHLSLQSGSNLILKRMKRRYSAEQMCDRIARLRAKVPELVISADVMVGFPTEQESHFDETIKAIREMEVAFPHVFSYSERDGTPAARIPMPKQVPVDVRKQRNKQVRKLGESIAAQVLHRRVGTYAHVLPEKDAKRKGYTLCRAEDYLSVLVPSDSIQIGIWQQVRYDAIDNGELIAKTL